MGSTIRIDNGQLVVPDDSLPASDPRYRSANGVWQVSTDDGVTWANVGSSSIADGSVTLAKLANLATKTFIGRDTAGTGVPEAVTATQLTADLNAATTSLQGMQSAADKVSATAANARWEVVQAAFLLSKVPQLTDFQYMKLGQYPLGGIDNTAAFANSAAVVGGGVINIAGATAYAGGPVIADAQTGKFGIVWRGKLAVTITGTFAELGLANSAASRHMGVQSQFDQDATHYGLAIAATFTAGTVVNNAGYHDFAITSDGTTATLWVDGVSAATHATSGVTVEGLAPALLGTTAGDTIGVKFLVGYIAP